MIGDLCTQSAFGKLSCSFLPSDGDILQGPPPPTAFVPAGAEDGDEMDLYCGTSEIYLKQINLLGCLSRLKYF